jgi:UrcA family protein
MFARTFSALAGLACAVGILVLSTPVIAAELPTATIRIADLDLNSAEGMATFERRVRAAAREICGPSELGLRVESKTVCYSEVRAVAMSKAELAMGEKPAETAQR